MDDKQFQSLLNEHNELLALVEGRHKDLLTAKQQAVFKAVREDFIDKLSRDENGNVKMTSENIALLNSIDRVFNYESLEINKTIVASLASAVNSLAKSNASYFAKADGNAKVLQLLPKVNDAMSGWLGINGGTVQKNGFIDQLVRDDTAKIAVKNMAMKIVIGQQGLEGAKTELKTLIEGNKDRLGLFEKHYKTFANDLYSQIDRATANVIRNDLKFEFAIYVGGLIETSREFCEEHNDNIYHISEILKFDPKVGIPPNYDPIHDLGGYNCRHHLRWISTAMARAKGKDVDKFINKDAVKPKPEPKPKKETKKTEPTPTNPKPIDTTNPRFFDANKPFDEIEVKIQKFIDKEFEKVAKQKKGLQSIQKKADEYWDKYREADGDFSRKYGDIWDEATMKKWEAEVLPFKNKSVEFMNEYDKKNADIQKFGSDFLKKHLDELEPDNAMTFSGRVGAKRKQIEEVFGKFKKLANGYFSNKEIKIRVVKGRAFARLQSNEITVAPTENDFVIFHELGHLTENNNYIRKASTDFLLKRTAGKEVQYFYKTEKFRGYGFRSDERFQDGGFYHEYVGKIYESSRYYKGRSATEVISMGLEQMLRDPVKFYNDDKEHFELIYNLFFKK